ncbi:MAG: hypothetical protein JO165_04905 [Candidatus Eremiobacteraeota bacterium]|nr:hypothetical protein [Candidatus Eremiobacteraeota bacterium]
MDERKNPFQDEFTENESKLDGAEREDVESSERLDTNINSQEGDEMVERLERDQRNK